MWHGGHRHIWSWSALIIGVVCPGSISVVCGMSVLWNVFDVLLTFQVAKNRFDGELGIMLLKFDKETLSFAVKSATKDDRSKGS